MKIKLRKADFGEEHIKEFLESADEVFLILSKAIEENEVESLLEGPISHSSFQRLN